MTLSGKKVRSVWSLIKQKEPVILRFLLIAILLLVYASVFGSSFDLFPPSSNDPWRTLLEHLTALAGILVGLSMGAIVGIPGITGFLAGAIVKEKKSLLIASVVATILDRVAILFMLTKGYITINVHTFIMGGLCGIFWSLAIGIATLTLKRKLDKFDDSRP